jgi:hypothetical protein
MRRVSPADGKAESQEEKTRLKARNARLLGRREFSLWQLVRIAAHSSFLPASGLQGARC